MRYEKKPDRRSVGRKGTDGTDYNIRPFCLSKSVDITILKVPPCVDQEVLLEGSKFDNFFLVDVGIKDSNTAINGLSSARQRNAIKMAFRWRADDGPTLNAGLVALWFFRGSGPVLQGNPIFLWFFMGGGGGGRDPLSPPLDPPMTTAVYSVQ